MDLCTSERKLIYTRNYKFECKNKNNSTSIDLTGLRGIDFISNLSKLDKLQTISKYGVVFFQIIS